MLFRDVIRERPRSGGTGEMVKGLLHPTKEVQLMGGLKEGLASVFLCNLQVRSLESPPSCRIGRSLSSGSVENAVGEESKGGGPGVMRECHCPGSGPHCNRTKRGTDEKYLENQRQGS